MIQVHLHYSTWNTYAASSAPIWQLSILHQCSLSSSQQLGNTVNCPHPDSPPNLPLQTLCPTYATNQHGMVPLLWLDSDLDTTCLQSLTETALKSTTRQHGSGSTSLLSPAQLLPFQKLLASLVCALKSHSCLGTTFCTGN